MYWMNLLSDFIPQISWALPELWKIWWQNGNSVILVDHDTQVLSNARWIIEMGPEAGSLGGQIIAQGTVRDLTQDPASKIGPFLSGKAISIRERAKAQDLFALGRIHLSTSSIHTVRPLEADIPKGRLTLVTGVSVPERPPWYWKVWSPVWKQ